MTLMPQPVDDGALALIEAIAGTRDARVSASVLSTYRREAGAVLQGLGLLARIGDEPIAPSLADHDDEPVLLSPSTDGRSVGYFSPTAGWVTPSQGDLGIFGLQFGVLFAALLDGLDCVPAVQPRELVSGLVWEAGAARLPGRAARVPVWLARRLSDQEVWDAFRDQIGRRPSPGLRLVLSLTPESRLPRAYVEGHEIVDVRSVIVAGGELRIDPQILAARLAHGRDTGEPITMSADGGVITVRGKTYSFTGAKQRAIVRYLFEAWQRGEPQCLTAAVLEAAESSDQVRTLARAFSGREDWREFIGEEGGRCWIQL